jgi:hypothetical protein
VFLDHEVCSDVGGALSMYQIGDSCQNWPAYELWFNWTFAPVDSGVALLGRRFTDAEGDLMASALVSRAPQEASLPAMDVARLSWQRSIRTFHRLPRREPVFRSRSALCQLLKSTRTTHSGRMLTLTSQHCRVLPTDHLELRGTTLTSRMRTQGSYHAYKAPHIAGGICRRHRGHGLELGNGTTI